MKLGEFQRVVLRIGNQMFVRHYLWLNYPNDPQLMGIQLQGAAHPDRYKKARSCSCGTCPKCKHTDYVRENRAKPVDGLTRLTEELANLGFTWHEGLKVWAIERTSEPTQ